VPKRILRIVPGEDFGGKRYLSGAAFGFFGAGRDTAVLLLRRGGCQAGLRFGGGG